jgi:hypothetical protein
MLRPSDDQIRELALREATTSHAAAFEPVARGPVFAVVALAVVGVLAVPLTIWQLLLAVGVRLTSSKAREK